MKRRIERRIGGLIVILLAFCSLFGCNGKTPPVEISDLTGRTAEALSELLLGPTEDSPTRTTPQDKPLLQRGGYESAYLSADGKGFEEKSRRVLSEKRVAEIMKAVAEDLTRRGRKRGFAVQTTDYPATIDAEKTLIATFTPAITDVSPSVGANKNRVGDKLLMARLTVTDAKTGAVLAERLYYTGTDVGGLQRGEPLRYKKIR